jgi:hypothetical protein
MISNLLVQNWRWLRSDSFDGSFAVGKHASSDSAMLLIQERRMREQSAIQPELAHAPASANFKELRSKVKLCSMCISMYE